MWGKHLPLFVSILKSLCRPLSHWATGVQKSAKNAWQDSKFLCFVIWITKNRNAYPGCPFTIGLLSWILKWTILYIVEFLICKLERSRAGELVKHNKNNLHAVYKQGQTHVLIQRSALWGFWKKCMCGTFLNESILLW